MVTYARTARAAPTIVPRTLVDLQLVLNGEVVEEMELTARDQSC